MITLDKKVETLLQQLNEEDQLALDLMQQGFSKYISGEEIPRKELIEESLTMIGVEEETKKDATRKLMFLRYAQNTLPNLASEFITAYPLNRHSPEFNLGNFMLAWDSTASKLLLNDADPLGKYATLLEGIIELLEDSNELKNHLYDNGFMPDSDTYRRLGLCSVLTTNLPEIERVIVENLPPELNKKITPFTSGKYLAVEAAENYLKVYPKLRLMKKFSLENYLKFYDITLEQMVFAPKPKGSYYGLFRKLKMQNNEWQSQLYNLLEEPLKSRVIISNEEQRKKGGTTEEIIQLLEGPLNSQILECFRFLGSNQNDLDDVFLAMRLPNIDDNARKMLSQIGKDKDVSVQKYLGMCRINQADSELKYDWMNGLMRICSQIDPAKFDANGVLAAILLHKSIMHYSEVYIKSPAECMRQLESNSLTDDANQASNQVYAWVAKRTHAHYKLRQKIGQVSGFRKS